MGSPLPHLHRDWAHPCHIRTGTGLSPAHTSTPERGSTPCRICAGTECTLPHLHRDWVPPRPLLRRNWAHPCHICTGTGLALRHLHRDWVHPLHRCSRTGLPPPTLSESVCSQALAIQQLAAQQQAAAAMLAQAAAQHNPALLQLQPPPQQYFVVPTGQVALPPAQGLPQPGMAPVRPTDRPVCEYSEYHMPCEYPEYHAA